jgi:hypothetical protein
MATISNVTFALGIAETPYSTEAAKNATYYYNTQGDATAEYFLTANVGTVTLSNGFANVTITANLDKLNPGESKAYSIVIRRGSASGPIISSSNTITIISDSSFYNQASGGNVEISGDYKIHTFTTSGNLILSSAASVTPLGYSNVNYLVVAGGGGGAAGFNNGGFGHGGGAGGLLTGNVVFSSVGNVLIVIGGGGNGGAGSFFGAPPSPIGGIGLNGGNTIFGSFTCFGGGGAPGKPGGSGAGGPPTGFGSGVGGQGFPGGWPGVFPSPNPDYPRTFQGPGGGGSSAGKSPADTTRQANSGVQVPWAPNLSGAPAPVGRFYSMGGGGGLNTISGSGGTPGLTPQSGPTTGSGGGGGEADGSSSSTNGAGGSPGVVVIRYPFKPAPTYTITESASGMISNSSVIYAIVTTGLTANARFYYTLTGNVTTNDIDTPLSGSFIVSNNRANLQIVSNTSAIVGRVFGLQMRRLSTIGKVIATGNVISINPISYVEASGGIITDSAGYRIHSFTNSGNLQVSSIGTDPSFNTLEYIVVAGGGGGASGTGGGGGAGGYISSSRVLNSTGNLLVIVGAGGAAGVHPGYNPGTQGVNSRFADDTAIGGGAGGAVNPGARQGYPGGSGGGGAIGSSSGGSGYNYPGPTQQGYPGGFGNPAHASGGGGAGQIGNPNGAGGNGIETSISGTPNYYAGGGGGGAGNNSTNPLAIGGLGGGGNGGAGNDSGAQGQPGTTNSGGGGGGGGLWQGVIFNPGGVGGSGIVIIRYPYAT